jgi:beta-glucuronidase
MTTPLPAQNNACRSFTSLDGLWKFRIERAGDDASGWPSGFPATRLVAVPASFNEQFTDYETFNHMGVVWYEREFEVTADWLTRPVSFRFAAVNYAAEVFLNGQQIGSHVTGYTPFECPAGNALAAGINRLVVRVDCALSPDTVPQGGFDKGAIPGLSSPFHPSVNFDFFPYSGILRPVTLCVKPETRIEALHLDTEIGNGSAQVRVRVCASGQATRLRLTIEETGEGAELPFAAEEMEASIAMKSPRLWGLWQPNLYHLRAELLDEQGAVIDSYRQRFGVRSVKVEGDRILLNGAPVYLKGFGRHEDAPVIGRGLAEAFNVRDMELLRWIGGNSIRTAHYPHAEEMLDLADRLGVLVISESPAVSMIPSAASTGTLELHIRSMREFMRRDYNHPSVIAWCLANEPHSHEAGAVPYFEKVFAAAREEDRTRPMMIVMCRFPSEKCHHLCDLVGLNAYPGWYNGGDTLENTQAYFRKFLDEVRALTGKPVLMTEFGGDAMAGLHSLPASLWTEDYQSDLIQALIDVIREKDFIVGEHLWVFADFHTAQNHFRAYGNRKGLFTRDRQPKLAARMLRERWREVGG